MPRRYLVVDQNVLRKQDLANLILYEQETRFVLPDLSFLEMTKSPEWESTLRSSLAQLAGIPTRVVVAHSVNDALRRELADLRTTAGHMIHREATEFVRGILEWVRTGNDTDSIIRIRQDPDNHKVSLATDFLDHSANKVGLTDLIDATRRLIPRDAQKRLRKLDKPSDDRLQIVHEIATGLLPEILAERGISRNKCHAFMRQRPVLYRYLLVRAWYCVDWIAKGGIESYGNESVTNELLDQQYVITASSFSGIVSQETKVNQAYADLISLLPLSPG
jgi:hypothetical protein